MDVNRQYTNIFFQMMNGWAVIDSLRQVAVAGMPYAEEVLAAEHRSFVADLALSGRLQEIIIGMVDADDLAKTSNFLGKRLTEQCLQNASYSIDAASLVFAHTVLDDALSSFLEITTQSAPEYWNLCVKDKKVELGVLATSSVADALRSAVAKEVSRIRRNESLINKCEMLHAICKPSGPLLTTDYRFDIPTLQDIDTLRQNIIHGDGLGGQIPDVEVKLSYLRETWTYFFAMMHKTFGLQMDPTAIGRSRNT